LRGAKQAIAGGAKDVAPVTTQPSPAAPDSSRRAEIVAQLRAMRDNLAGALAAD
jgi:hypothetical protein